MDCVVGSDFQKCVLQCRSAIVTEFDSLNSRLQNTFSTGLIFGDLFDNSTLNAAETLHNKLQVFSIKLNWEYRYFLIAW